VDIEFDPDKDAINIVKHGISLALAERFDIETALVKIDEREDYGEDRWIAVGLIDAGLYVLIFTERDGRIRVISLRKAQKSEVQNYVEQKSRYGY
jgi:uncharacterized DUF497 family protein